MAMELNFKNVFGFISTVSPILLGFFMLMISVFNQNVKGLIYLAGTIIAILINTFILRMEDHNHVEGGANPSCGIFEYPASGTGGKHYKTPSSNSMFIAFTFAYLIMPMYVNGTMNVSVILSLLGLFSIDAYSGITNGCSKIPGVALGGVVGLLLGFAWFSVFHKTGHASLLFYNEIASDGVVCDRPSSQTFKCRVFKNGELIGNV